MGRLLYYKHRTRVLVNQEMKYRLETEKLLLMSELSFILLRRNFRFRL